MKILHVIIVIFLTLITFCKSDFNYAGSTLYGPAWNPPTLESGICTPNSTAQSTKYQGFNVNFTTPTFVEVVGMFQSSMIYTGRLWIFDIPLSNFNVTAAENCELLIKGIETTGFVPPVYVGFMLPAGNFTLVVTDSAGQAGQFVINVRVAQYTGNTYNASKTIRTPPSTGLADGVVSSCTTTSGITQRYDSYTWTQSSTGIFDIHLWFFNQSTTIFPMIFLYSGNFPSVGSPSDPPDACVDGNLLWASGYYFTYYTALPSITLNAGSTYTVVATPGSSTKNWAFVGVVIVPTIWGNTTNQPQNFTAPDTPAGGNITTCVADGKFIKKFLSLIFIVNLKYWQAFKFVAQYSGYIFDTGDLNTAQMDTASILYNGDNTGNPPSMCTGFIISSDTGDGAPISIFLTPGETYTLVVTAFQPGADQTGRFPLYMLTGLPLVK